jgi:hypothetical protein
MDKKLKSKWVKALLSGEFEQTTGCLRDSKGYCCLGVLHKVATGSDPYTLWDGDRPKCVEKIGHDAELALAAVNDDGVPFEMIAGLIDEAL